MSFYTDFITSVEQNNKLFEEIGPKIYPPNELQYHAAEYAVFQSTVNFMKEATIIRLRGEQSAIFLETPFDNQQDFIQWLRLPYEMIYIEPDTPFKFTGYAPKTEDELREWHLNHAKALTQEERERLEQLRREPEPDIRGVLLMDATKYLGNASYLSDIGGPGWTRSRGPIQTHKSAMMIDGTQGVKPFSLIEGLAPDQFERLFHVIFIMPLAGYPMNIHSFTIGVLKDNTLWCAQRTSTRGVLGRAQQWVIHLINFLSSPSVKLVPNQPDAALQKARARRGKPPLPGWYEISLRQIIKDYTKDKMSAQGWHHSFRYDVRGHFRRYTEGRLAGRCIWVASHQRGLANQLYRPKGYKQEGL